MTDLDRKPPHRARLVKTCGCCGRTFTAVEWLALETKGAVKFEADEGGPAFALDLRNCVCGSTIAIDAEVLAPK